MNEGFVRQSWADRDKALDAPIVTLPDATQVHRLRTMSGFGDLVTDAWGVPKVSIPRSEFHGLWTFDIPASMWFMYEDGTQVYSSTHIASTNGAAVLTADTDVNVVLMESRQCPRYQPNRGHLLSTALWAPDATADGERDWGCFTTENGVFFRLKSDGLLYAVLRSGSSETEALIDTSGVSGFDVTKGNVYDIQYQWRGVGNYKFYINLTLVHTIENLGTLTALSMENPALPIAFQCTYTTENAVLKIGCADVSSENGTLDAEQYRSAYASAVAVVTDTPVLCVYHPLQISSKTNTRTLSLARGIFTCSKKAVFTFWTTRDSTGITGATFKAIGNGSFTQTDSTDIDATAVRATSVTLAKLTRVMGIPVEAAVPRVVDLPLPEKIVFPVVRGDYLVVTCTAATATADAVLEWGEQI